MCRVRTVIALLAFAHLPGCVLGYFVAKASPPLEAQGAWQGIIQPVVLRAEQDDLEIVGTELTVADGPELRRNEPGVVPVPTAGRRAVLVNKRKEVLPWSYSTTQSRWASVNGFWTSEHRYALWKGEPMLQAAVPQQVSDIYSVIITNRIEAGPVTTLPATTQNVAIKLTAKLVSADQIDLSWTPLPGTVTYRVELSEDGVEYHESLEVEAPATSASLVGFDEARSGQEHHIRVVALDAKDRTLATSNVRVIKSPP